MDKCSNSDHAHAMNALASLSQTQFGRAALERHGHNPMTLEEARAHQKGQQVAEGKTSIATGPGATDGKA